jgi:BMFP domain-containing protein YqiC
VAQGDDVRLASLEARVAALEDQLATLLEREDGRGEDAPTRA